MVHAAVAGFMIEAYSPDRAEVQLLGRLQKAAADAAHPLVHTEDFRVHQPALAGHGLLDGFPVMPEHPGRVLHRRVHVVVHRIMVEKRARQHTHIVAIYLMPAG
ncbi:hypothetical protein D3C75_862360 [compost metagenome]